MLGMFLLSGLAALVYQIVWARQLYLVFGVTIYATSAVVTTFMAGLALGSIYFGRLVDRWERPIFLFALLELGIGLFGFAFPAIIAVLRPAYVGIYGLLGGQNYAVGLARFALSFGILILPTSLMGGTLPVLARAYVSHGKRLGGEVAGLYSANNLGAFLGCALAGYLFIELLGLKGTLALAGSLNLLVAALAFALAVRLPAAATTDSPSLEAAGSEPERLPTPVKVALWVFGIEGFTSLAYQMAWVRMLVFFVQSNIYAVTAIVATYLLGLSVGAFVVKRLVDRARDPYRVLGVIELGIAFSALVTVPLLPWMLGFQRNVQDALWHWGWAGSTLARFVICGAVILVPTSFMGATMPLAARIYLPTLRRLGKKMGVIGCLDTVGSILGAFAGGFVLIPLLGIQRTIIATALVNLALAAWVFWAARAPGQTAALRPGFVVSAAALLAAPMLFLLRPMPLIYASRALDAYMQRELLYYDEGMEDTVSVIRAYDFTRGLFVDQSDAAWTDRFDRPSHELVAHVPLLLNSDPKRVLLVGFGIGFTTQTCRVYNTDVDVVELSSGVVRANPLFAEDNGHVLSDAQHVHLTIDDGRNFVLRTDRKYDMVHVGIIYPGLTSGNASFFTVDFFRECKRILAPGGVVSQWVPIHGMAYEDFRLIVRSFLEVFPHGTVWYKQTANFCTLVATVEPLRVDFQNLEERVNRPGIRAHLGRCNVEDVYDLLDTYCCGGSELRDLLGPGRLHSDDHPYLEFGCSRPVSLLGYPQIIRFLTEARRPVWPLLVNVPPERANDVRAQLDRWYQATEHLLQAHYYSALIETGRLRDDEFAESARRMETEFARVLTMNPADENARFIWRRASAARELDLASRCMLRGLKADALRHLAVAKDLAPGTFPGAQAKFLYEQALAPAAR